MTIGFPCDGGGRTARCVIIAEVAQAHDGSLGLAHAHIEAAARAGADAVKFQTHIASAESTPAEPWRVRFSEQDATRYEYWRRMEFAPEHWAGLKRHAEERGLVFLSSAFSTEAVELLERLDLAAWKVASGELGNPGLLDRMIATGRPILLSSGMSGYGELDAAVARVRRGGNALIAMQCTTAYPCRAEDVGLNVIEEFRARYGGEVGVGLSDHSGTIWPGVAAAARGEGIDALEVHLTLSREMFGPDVGASVTSEELKRLVEGVRFAERMRSSPVDKEARASDFEEARRIFGKSAALREGRPAGWTLRAEDLTTKKPGTGIPATRLGELVGRRLSRAVPSDRLLTEEDLE